MVPSMHVNQRVRLPNEVNANRKTCKVWKTHVHHTSYMSGNTTRKANIHASKNGIIGQMYFLVANLLEVSPVVMNYKMRHNKNRPARYSLVWYLWWQMKWKNTFGTCVRLHARVAMEEGLLSVCVS